MALIKKHEKSGVLFFSGDVHYAQLFTSKCSSLTGYVIPEVCSSGMTHVLTDVYFNILNTIEVHTPRQFKDSEMIADFNYATIEIEKAEQNDIKVTLSVKNIFNSNIL